VDGQPQQISVGALFQKRAKHHDLVGHRWILGSVVVHRPNPTEQFGMTTTSRSLTTPLYGPRSLAARSAKLHHYAGPDPVMALLVAEMYVAAAKSGASRTALSAHNDASSWRPAK
jgi:hypothetical protein